MLVAKFVPGVLTIAAPQQLRDEFSTIVSEFHPVDFRLVSLWFAETDTRELWPNIDVPTLLLWDDDDRRNTLQMARQFDAAIPAVELAIMIL